MLPSMIDLLDKEITEKTERKKRLEKVRAIAKTVSLMTHIGIVSNP